MGGRRSSRIPELKVVFETSAIFTGSASDLLRTEVVEIIKGNSAFPDLKITWHLPEIVVQERQHQMLQQARGFLPSIQKLERLLGHNLSIDAAFLEHRVLESIKTQIDSLGLLVRHLDVAQVDWGSLIQAAVFRKPPFDPGEKEKGFRDSIAIETFSQLVAASPVTPKICRVAMVTGDKLLAEAIRSRASQATNVRVLETLEELTGLINTLVADVDEEFIGQLVPRAQKYFFQPRENSTLYYSQKLGERLYDEFKAQLAEMPAVATRRENDKWLIASPRFVRKERQRIFWTSRITVEATAFFSEPIAKAVSPLYSHTLTPGIREAASGAYPNAFSYPTTRDLIASTLATWGATSSSEEKEIAKGKTILEVDWSVSVSTSRSLSKPRIEKLRFVETVWD